MYTWFKMTLGPSRLVGLPWRVNALSMFYSTYLHYTSLQHLEGGDKNEKHHVHNSIDWTQNHYIVDCSGG